MNSKLPYARVVLTYSSGNQLSVPVGTYKDITVLPAYADKIREIAKANRENGHLAREGELIRQRDNEHLAHWDVESDRFFASKGAATALYE